MPQGNRRSKDKRGCVATSCGNPPSRQRGPTFTSGSGANARTCRLQAGIWSSGQARLSKAGVVAAGTALISSFLSGCQSGSLEGLRELDSLQIEGNTLLSDSDVKEGLALEESSWIPLVGQKRYFNGDVLRDDVRRIPRIYEAKGVYGTVVEGTRIDNADADKADVTFLVREGFPVRVANVEVEGLPPDLSEKLPEPFGPQWQQKRFEEADHEKAKRSLLTLLQNEGHFYAKVESEARVDVGTRQAHLLYRVDPGTRYFVGPLSFSGTQRTNPEQLREHLTLKEGALVRNSEKMESQDALSSLGVFRSASVLFPDAPPEGNTIPVDIRLLEGDERNIKLGAGLGAATGRNEARGRFDFTHSNLFGGLRRFDAEFRPAYVYVPSFTAPEKKGLAGSASLRLFQPDFLQSLGTHSLGGLVSLSGSRDIQDAYTADSAAFRTGLAWPTDSPSNMEAGYDFEIFSLASLPPSVTQCRSLCTISFLDQRFTFDRRDDVASPRKGYWLSLSLAEAGLGGDFTYTRVTPEARVYLAAHDKVTIATRAQMGWLFHAVGEDTPLPKRYSLGGATTHRGFGNRRLSPSVKDSKGRRVPIGGESSALFNQELRWEALEKFFVIGFFDTGAVKEEQGRVPVGTLNHAVGMGLAYDTGVIPVRLDLGYRTNRRPEYAHEGAFAFHLNLGEAF